MNLLDEQVTADQRVQLRAMRISIRHIGFDTGRKGMLDDEILSFLRQRRRITFFTRDWDFYNRNLCHARYCLVYLGIEKSEVASFVRRFLRHTEFNTEAQRMGRVVRVAHSGITFWQLHQELETHVDWG